PQALCSRARSPCRVLVKLLRSTAAGAAAMVGTVWAAARVRAARRRRTRKDTNAAASTTIAAAAAMRTAVLPGICGSISHTQPNGRDTVRRKPSGALVHRDRDDLRNARFLHRNTVEDIRGLHRTLVVRDHNELRVCTHVPKQSGKAADVG